VLEQAQAAGQKSQQDALIGQGSIFDLEGGGAGPPGAGTRSPLTAPSHPAIPSGEFEQAELLAVEKESIGLFISAHPLKQVREALRARVDCPLSELGGRRDKDWVTVGGIIAQAKRIRTRNGEPMMFATLDDLEGSVEMLVFGKTLHECEAALGVDRVVLVRGRVDHKEAEKTCLVAQTVEVFEPTDEEVAAAKRAASARVTSLPLSLRVDAALLPASFLDELKQVLVTFPGDSEVVLEIGTANGARRLRLGPEFRVAPTPALRAELAQILGPAAAATAAAAG
jgi:DNA polymerase-3 subunit alpha